MGKDVFQDNLMNLHDSLQNFAMFLTCNHDDACDLMQDTILKALDNRDKFANDTNLKGWLYTIMRNIFINNYRRSFKNASLAEIDEAANASCTESETNFPEINYTMCEINDAINLFPAEYREPFALHMEGYKYEEIADLLQLPLGTVKSRIHFTRSRLQTYFAVYKV